MAGSTTIDSAASDHGVPDEAIADKGFPVDARRFTPVTRPSRTRHETGPTIYFHVIAAVTT
jgi:hypothetical protein